MICFKAATVKREDRNLDHARLNCDVQRIDHTVTIVVQQHKTTQDNTRQHRQR